MCSNNQEWGGGVRNSYKILVGKQEGKKLLGKLDIGISVKCGARM
jgi:hypothetical protein